MDGAQLIDGGDIALLLAIVGSVVLFTASLLVAAGTTRTATRGNPPPRFVNRLSVIVAVVIALGWIALVVGANLGVDIGLW